MIPGVSDTHEIALTWLILGVVFVCWGATRLVALWMDREDGDAPRAAVMLSLAAMSFDAMVRWWEDDPAPRDLTIELRWLTAACAIWALIHSIREIREALRARREDDHS